MGLLSAAELQDLAAFAIDAGLANKRKLLFLGFAVDAEASLMSADDGPDSDLLRADLRNLNNADEYREGGYYLSIWLKNCQDQLLAAQPAKADYFKKVRDRIEALSRPRPPLPEESSPLPAAIRAESGTQVIDSLVAQLRLFINAMAGSANDLMIAKRLHDKLHSIQGPLTGLRSMMNQFPDYTLFKAILQTQVQMISSHAMGMSAELTGLPAGDELAVMGGVMVERLRARIDQLDHALAGGARSEALIAMSELRGEVREQMEELAARIEADRWALNLPVLITVLQGLATKAQGAELASQASNAAGSLTLILQDLSSLGPQHRAWQDFDGWLWSAEDLFDNLGKGEFAQTSFQSNWKRLGEKLAALAGNPPPDWYPRHSAIADEFAAACPMPITAPPTSGASTILQNFIDVNRKIFYEIDLRLISSCDRLGAITRQGSSL